MKQDEIEIITPNGEAIRGFYQDPYYLNNTAQMPPFMIFCHGFPGDGQKGHNNLFKHLQNICARIGMASLRFDFRGCGASDGFSEHFTTTSAIEDFDCVYDWAESQKFDRFMITMEGLGSVPALMNLHKNVEALAFLWPVFNTRDYAIRNLEAKDHLNTLEDGGFIQINYQNIGLALIKELYEMDITPLMHRVIMPTLIQQGAKDEKIPIEFLDMARAHFRNRRIELTTYQDGIYGLPKEAHRKYVLYHYEQFIQKYV